jgi:predicted permease
MWQDLRYAARTLRKSPGFTLVVVLSLTLGIGANTAIFSVINAILLRALPVSKPAELSLVQMESRLPMSQRFSYPMFQLLRDALPAPSAVAAASKVQRSYANLEAGREPETTWVQLVSGEFFGVIGLPPTLGRTLNADDNRTVGGHPVAVLSEGLWRRRFGGARDVLGRDVTINGAHFTIVGVAPAGFTGIQLEQPVDVWAPVMMQADVRYQQNYSSSNSDDKKPWVSQPGIRWLDVIVRDKNHAAAAALNVAFHRQIEEDGQRLGNLERRKLFLQQSLVLQPFGRGFSTLRQRFETPLYALMVMVGLVLLISCANTANLLLARAGARQREIAVRLSLGAQRMRLIRQLLTESFLIVAAAATSGVLVAWWAGDFLVRMTLNLGASTSTTPFSVAPDARVLGFTVLLSAFTALLFGLAPAFRATSVDLNGALKQAGRGVYGGSRWNGAKLLVAAQVALSLLLVVGAGLFVRSLQNLMHLEMGFERDHLLEARVDPETAGIPVAQLPALNRSLIERLEAVPGVRQATVAMCGIAGGCASYSDGILVEGYQSRPDEQMLIETNAVGPNYLQTVGMHLIAGRDLDSRDTASSPPVAIVNESMARRYFAGKNAVGRHFGFQKPVIEIVGVVRDARVNKVQEAAEPMVWFPIEQRPVPADSIEVRAAGDAGVLADMVRRAIQEVNPNLPVVRIRTMTEQIEANVVQERLVARLATVFGGLALALACFGLYGVMSYAVSRRTPELGIRMALGATPGRVLSGVFAESLVLVSLGLLVGGPLVLAVTRPLSSMLFNVNARDPFTLIGAALALAAVAALAGFIPARRASRVDPLVALRYE